MFTIYFSNYIPLKIQGCKFGKTMEPFASLMAELFE